MLTTLMFNGKPLGHCSAVTFTALLDDAPGDGLWMCKKERIPGVVDMTFRLMGTRGDRPEMGAPGELRMLDAPGVDSQLRGRAARLTDYGTEDGVESYTFRVEDQ